MPVEYESFNTVFMRASALLGEEMDFPEKIFRQVQDYRNPEHLYQVLRKLAYTLEREISPLAFGEDRTEAVTRALDNIIDALRRYSGRKKRNIPAYAECSLPGRLGHMEAGLRNLLFGRQPVVSEANLLMGEDKGKLMLDSLLVTEKCRMGCDFCSIDAKAGGAEMDLSLVDDMIDGRAFMANSLYLGDGEVLLHSDPRLPFLVRELIADYGVSISLSTTGLASGNEEWARWFIANLSGLGEYQLDLDISVSFNLLNPVARKDTGLYLERIFRTFDLLHEAGIPSVRIALMHAGNADETRDALDSYKGRCGLFIGDRHVGKLGRALENDAYPAEDRIPTHCSLSGAEDHFLRTRPWRLGPGGDVYSSCLNAGKAGAVFGNVYENDVAQMLEQREHFFREVLPGLARKRPGISICEVHRASGFKPPKDLRSKNPVLGRRTA